MTLRRIGLITLAVLSMFAVLTLLCGFFAPAQYWQFVMRLLAFLWLIVASTVLIVDLIFLIPTIRGAIYLPTNDTDVAAMLQLAKIQAGEKAVDIGSGDGRIVRALAQAGANAHGYELNGILVWWSRWKSRHLPPPQQGHFHWANMWAVDFSSFDVVTLFGMTYIMKDLEAKLRRELKPGARVVCNSFPFPNWRATKSRGKLHLYTQFTTHSI